jgi:hypothetical protein
MALENLNRRRVFMPSSYRTAHGLRQLQRAIGLLELDLTVAERCQILRVNARQQRRLMAEAKELVERQLKRVEVLETAVVLATLCAQVIARLPSEEKVELSLVFDQLQILLGDEIGKPLDLRGDEPDPLAEALLLGDDVMAKLETLLLDSKELHC